MVENEEAVPPCLTIKREGVNDDNRSSTMNDTGGTRVGLVRKRATLEKKLFERVWIVAFDAMRDLSRYERSFRRALCIYAMAIVKTFNAYSSSILAGMVS